MRYINSRFTYLHTYLTSKLWPRSRPRDFDPIHNFIFGLDLIIIIIIWFKHVKSFTIGLWRILDLKALASVSAWRFWPRLTSLVTPDLNLDFIWSGSVFFDDFLVSQWFSEPACYPVWIHCCKRPIYDFCISQGSVAAALRLGGQNYSRLCCVSLRCCVPKIIKFGQCFTELFTK